jgi:methylglutaconyl-CoA hydratase
MNWQSIDITMHERVATVTLNRPDVRNAFNEATIAELALAFDELGRDEAVRGIVLAANGPPTSTG